MTGASTLANISSVVGQIFIYAISTVVASAAGVGAHSLWRMAKSMREVHEVTMGTKDDEGNVLIPSVREQFVEVTNRLGAQDEHLAKQDAALASLKRAIKRAPAKKAGV